MSSLPVRRVKTYTSSSGYVYQYYFVGQRDTDGGEPATEFIFDVTRDRHATFAFSVFLPSAAAASWAAVHQRSLSGPERYAAAKMRLLRGFDELGSADLLHESRQLKIEAAQLEEFLSELGVV